MRVGEVWTSVTRIKYRAKFHTKIDHLLTITAIQFDELHWTLESAR